ncbi:transmembrane protein 242-like protein [Leptotrombidium deliense]|uniref:Transmembrane protein 242 n=1 Tax=Leptotrombidium deliense TaxID=299467 RepID=A0A443SKA8_9ACAR|nr:transmembrane protein 242-like protein [Leptotrombidium deliense]
MDSDTQCEHKNNSSGKIVTRIPEIAFLTTVAAMSAMFGFGLTLAMAKKRDTHFFSKGLNVLPNKVPESGATLAMKALGIGTLYAVSGFGLFSFIVWKSLGVKNLEEFRQKVGLMLPQIPKGENSGKSDFKSLRELIDYICNDSTQR